MEQVEQNLLLSRLIIEIADDELLARELVFRGGTCLHKLHLPRSFRYSEDLDYVRRTASGIAGVMKAVSLIGERLGMDVSTRMSEQPKVYLRAPFESGAGKMRVKVEFNTHERQSARPLTRIPHAVQSSWYSGRAEVQTFSVEELLATKLRALYQRSKGRDLFDLWLALRVLETSPEGIVGAFAPYRPGGYTRKSAIANLREKMGRQPFRDDLRALVVEWPEGYDVEGAGDFVIEHVLDLITD